MVSVGLIWRRAFLTLRVGFGFDEKGRPKMNLIAPGTVAALRFAFLVLPREEPSNIARLKGRPWSWFLGAAIMPRLLTF